MKFQHRTVQTNNMVFIEAEYRWFTRPYHGPPGIIRWQSAFRAFDLLSSTKSEVILNISISNWAAIAWLNINTKQLTLIADKKISLVVYGLKPNRNWNRLSNLHNLVTHYSICNQRRSETPFQAILQSRSLGKPKSELFIWKQSEC